MHKTSSESHFSTHPFSGLSQVETAAAMEGLNSKTIGGLAMVIVCERACLLVWDTVGGCGVGACESECEIF